MKKEKINYEGQPCRHCGTPVKKQEHDKPSKKNGAYWFKWWFVCPKCKAMYMVEEAKVRTQL